LNNQHFSRLIKFFLILEITDDFYHVLLVTSLIAYEDLLD